MKRVFRLRPTLRTTVGTCCLLAFVGGAALSQPATVENATIPLPAASRPVAIKMPASHVDRQIKARKSQRLRARAVRNRARLIAQRKAIAAVHQDFWLHARGTQLYTAWNKPITIKAINWYGFEYAPFVPDGLDKASLDSILWTLHRLRFNALRITFANATVEWNPVVTRGLDANPNLKGLHSLDIMKRILQRAHHYGLRVILCDSRSEPGRGPEIKSGLWYTHDYPEASWRADWMNLVRRFRHQSSFVTADLRNEPHITGTVFDVNSYFKLGPLWGAFLGVYYHDRDWRYAAETMGNQLLAISPNLMIMVEGIQMYYDPDLHVLTGGLWGSNLIGVQYDPVVLTRPSQLMYSAHEYGPKMFRAPWFTPHTTYAFLADRWRQHWGYLLTAPAFMQAPIVIGEVGTCDDWPSCIRNPAKPGSQGFWFSAFVRYMKAHPQVGWAYWALNPRGPFRPHEDNFYSLMTPDWQHYHPLLVRGLAPLLAEPDG